MNKKHHDLKKSPLTRIRNIDLITGYLKMKVPKDFWGTVEIKYREGVPVMITEHRQMKLENK